MLFRKLKEWWSRFQGRASVRRTVQIGYTGDTDWHEDPFFTAHQAKTLRLKAIADERSVLKDRLQKAIVQKKARAPIYQALQALRNEEMRLELGRG